MRDDIERDAGVTYIGPRTFVAAFALVCAVFGGTLYGAPRIIEAFDPPALAAGRIAAGADAAAAIAPFTALPSIATTPRSALPAVGVTPGVALAAAAVTPRAARPAVAVTPRAARPAVAVTPRVASASVAATPRVASASVAATPRAARPAVGATPRAGRTTVVATALVRVSVPAIPASSIAVKRRPQVISSVPWAGSKVPSTWRPAQRAISSAVPKPVGSRPGKPAAAPSGAPSGAVLLVPFRAAGAPALKSALTPLSAAHDQLVVMPKAKP